MARENKRKRDARRFGATDRLADVILKTNPDDWWLGLHVHNAIKTGEITQEHVNQAIEVFRRVLSRSPVVVADNVNRYYCATDQTYWDWKNDFPALAAPWPSFFVEMKQPSTMLM